jgi:hypothetical protein
MVSSEVECIVPLPPAALNGVPGDQAAGRFGHSPNAEGIRHYLGLCVTTEYIEYSLQDMGALDGVETIL